MWLALGKLEVFIHRLVAKNYPHAVLEMLSNLELEHLEVGGDFQTNIM